ncbi:MAG TPA: alpha/beta fold hydrolase [Thermoanaerobaculia bacterium]|nr:alpha/beta fold hydrolase [Thermoanaerobaculia bacterium]
MSSRLLSILLALLLFPALARAEVPARFQGKLEPCRIERLDEEVLCGKLPVWENREARSGRKIDLHVVVLPAKSPSPVPDPLFYLSGGPGESAIELAYFFPQIFGRLRRDRDLVFVDQRGTGKSGMLACTLPGSEDDPQGYLREMFPIESIRACAAELSKKADLRQYTNIQVLDDLDDIRAWLGYERINLYGGSYGSRAAMVYLKRHPEHVRSVVLDALVPIDLRSPSTYARTAQTALDRLFDDCAAEEACRTAFPNLRTEMKTVLERLDRAPGKATVKHPKTGQPVELTIPRTSFTTTLRSMQYSPYGGYVLIPMVIHKAFEGDYGPIIRQALQRGGPANWTGGFLSITCAEDLARLDPAVAKRLAAGTYLGEDRVRQQKAACAAWPTARMPEDFWKPAESPVPVLVLSGWLDPVTPPEMAKETLEHLPNHAHVMIRDAAHGTDGLNDFPCTYDIITQFVESGSPIGLDTTCVNRMKRQPFALREEPPPQE